MPRLQIEWRAADVDGISRFHLGSIDVPDDDERSQQLIGLMLTVQCTQCRETHGKPISVCPAEEFAIPNSRGTANFVMKCSICQQQTSIVCETKNLTKMVYQFPVAEEDEAAEKKRKPPAAGNDYQPLCILDCRGLDIMETHLTGDCVAEGNSGQRFQFDLGADGELADYDERTQQPVTLSGFETRIIKL